MNGSKRTLIKVIKSEGVKLPGNSKNYTVCSMVTVVCNLLKCSLKVKKNKNHLSSKNEGEIKTFLDGK